MWDATPARLRYPFLGRQTAASAWSPRGQGTSTGMRVDGAALLQLGPTDLCVAAPRAGRPWEEVEGWLSFRDGQV